MNIQDVVMAVSAFSCGFLVAGRCHSTGLWELGIVTRLVGIPIQQKKTTGMKVWYLQELFLETC